MKTDTPSTPPTSRRRGKRLLFVVGALLLLFVLWIAYQVFLAPSMLEPVPVVISRETTYLTEPITPDGDVDFYAYRMQRRAPWAAPDENFFTALVEIFGPEVVSHTQDKKTLEALGVSAPWAGRDFGSLPDLSDQEWEQYEQAQTAPWKESDAPLVADYLESNRELLDQLADAARRPGSYLPLPDALSLSTDLGNGLLVLKNACELLFLRAYQSIQRGETEAAFSDAKTILRILDHYSRNDPTMIYHLISSAAHRRAYEIISLAVKSSPIDKRSLENLARELNPSPAESKPGERGIGRSVRPLREVLVSERLAYIVELSRFGGLGDLSSLGGAAGFVRGQNMIDPNVLLRAVNDQFDSVDRIFDVPKYVDRQTEFTTIETEMAAMTARVNRPPKLFWVTFYLSDAETRRQVLSRRLGEILINMTASIYQKSYQRELAALAARQISLGVIALARHHLAEGQYPETLDSLVPRFLPNLPRDPFADNAPLRYEAVDGGFRLYSFGIDGEDDAGDPDTDQTHEQP